VSNVWLDRHDQDEGSAIEVLSAVNDLSLSDLMALANEKKEIEEVPRWLLIRAEGPPED
jgi:hypothetical protein